MLFSLFIDGLSYSPTDPKYPEQFYLHNDGRYIGRPDEDISVVTAWDNDYTGKGINVLVIDDGCNYEHKDLIDNFDLEHSWNYQTLDKDPKPINETFQSGTSNAGIIAAKENDIAIIGVANDATIGCHRIDDINRTKANVIDSLKRDNDFWRVKLIGFPAKCLEDHCTHDQSDPELDKAISEAPSTVNFVRPAGSDSAKGGDTNFDSLSRNERVIIVTDTTNRGTHCAWGNRGTNILVSSPVGGSSSYDDTLFPTFPALHPNSTEETIEADPRNKGAASVAGAIADLLQINPRLTWRDVQAIIASTTTVIDPQHPSWKQNQNSIWYSHVYGFGRLNIDGMILAADAWVPLDKQHKVKATNNSTETLPTMRRGGIDKTFEINDTVKSIEYVQLSVTFNASDYSAIRMQLYSPLGGFAYVKAPMTGREENRIRTVDFTIRNFFGEDAKGTWKLHIISDGTAEKDVFINATLTVKGVATESAFQTYQRIVANPYENARFNKKATIKVESKNIVCGVPFNVSVSLPGDESSNLTVLLGDKGYHSRWPLLNSPVNSSMITQLQIPCYFQNNTKLNLTVENQEQEIWGSETITVTNGVKPTMELIYPTAYSVFHIKQDKTLDFSVMPRMDLAYMIDGASAQRARIQLYDIDADNITYEEELSLINNINLHIEEAVKCPRCILSFVPAWYSKYTNDCLNIIQPISILEQFEDPPEPWILNLTDECPIPSGVFTPTPIPEPTATPTPKRTNTPSPTVPGEGLKQNKAAITVGISFICIYGLGLIIFLFINRRRSEPMRQIDTIDFSFVE